PAPWARSCDAAASVGSEQSSSRRFISVDSLTIVHVVDTTFCSQYSGRTKSAYCGRGHPYDQSIAVFYFVLTFVGFVLRSSRDRFTLIGQESTNIIPAERDELPYETHDV